MTTVRHQHQPARALGEEQVHVFGVDEHQRDGEERRQSQQHVAGHAAVRRVDAHLAENLEPLAHDVGEVVEDLREVAAGLALDEHGGREEPHVEERHADRQVVQRVLQRQAEVLFFEGLPELGPMGSAPSSATMPIAVWNAWPALIARDKQIERLRELLFEPAEADASACA